MNAAELAARPRTMCRCGRRLWWSQVLHMWFHAEPVLLPHDPDPVQR